MNDVAIFTTKTLQLKEAHLIGHMTCSFDKLVELFHAPLEGDGYDRDAEWNVLLPNGHPVAIYNYRNGKNYLGKEGVDIKDITVWNINGFFDEDIQVVNELVNGKPGYTFQGKLIGKSKEDIVNRLRSIANHIEEGKEESSNHSDYHSWTLTPNNPNSVTESTKVTYPHI